MRAYLLNTCVAALLLGCVAVRAEPPRHAFDETAFAGLADATQLGRERLDYMLDGANGAELRLTRCAQVAETDEAAVREDQYPLLRLLRVNCEALARFAMSRPARRSYLPEALTPALVSDLPSQALPAMGGQVVPPVGGRLGALPGGASIEALLGGRVRVLTRSDDIVYTLMAQGDFDGDGLQDMLLRMDWHARDAFGHGVDLLQITRRSVGGPYESNWRLSAQP